MKTGRIQMLFFCSLGLTLAAISVSAAEPNRLGLDDFLRKVSEKHEGYRAADMTSRGAQSRSHESRAMFRPAMFGSAQYDSDSSPVYGPYPRDKTITKTFSLGVSQTFDFGLETKLSYLIMQTNVKGTTMAAFYPENGFYTDARPQLELSLPIWRGAFGSELRANQEAQEAAAEATSAAERFKAQLISAQAEQAYWRLVLARKILEVQKSSLDRTKALRDWASRRARLELGDRSDLMQADAAVQLRGLEMQASQDEERAAARAFNLQLGIEADQVSQELDDIVAEKLIEKAKLQVYTVRADLKAAEAQSRASNALARAGIERQSPSVKLSGSAFLTGRDRLLSPALGESITNKYQSWTVGVSVSSPLDFGLLERNRAGYRLEAEAAELAADRKELEVKSEYSDLVKRLEESKRRLELSLQIEKIQKEKAAYERSRQERGRSTTFQVISFDQDYAAARVARLRTSAEVLSLLATIKTFGDKQ